MNSRINHLAVWILVVVYFLIGWAWYAIFGEKWLNLHARTMTDIERTHNVGAYALAIVTAIIVNYALAWLIGRLNAPVLVRVSLCRILHDRGVFSFRNKSVAADFHRHGPSTRWFRD